MVARPTQTGPIDADPMETGRRLDAGSLGARRVLVMVPHPDDEALGCGGLIALLGRLGARFCVVFVTDGGASHPGSASWPRHRLAAQRESEAADALSRLGIGGEERVFLRLADAAMPKLNSAKGKAALSAVSALARRFDPDLALLPWRRDPHCDHRDTWTLATAALAASGCRPQTLEYAVWLDELGAPGDHPRVQEADRVVVDIAAVAELKRAAVMDHVSQTTRLIDDDPTAFRLTPATIDRLTGRWEAYWRPA